MTERDLNDVLNDFEEAVRYDGSSATEGPETPEKVKVARQIVLDHVSDLVEKACADAVEHYRACRAADDTAD